MKSYVRVTVSFPVQVTQHLAFVSLPTWGECDHNEVLAAVARECAAKGAAAVLLGLPACHWSWSFSQNDWLWKWGGAYFSSAVSPEQWAAQLSTMTAPYDMGFEIPILLASNDAAENISRAWADLLHDTTKTPPTLKKGWKEKAPTVENLTASRARCFEKGQERGIPLLTRLLAELLQEEELTEARLTTVVKALETRPWQTLYAHGEASIFEEILKRSKQSNVALFLLLTLRMSSLPKLQRCGELIAKAQLSLLTKHIVKYDFECKRVEERGMRTDLDKFLGSVARSRELAGQSLGWGILMPILHLLTAVCTPGDRARSQVLSEMCVLPQRVSLESELSQLSRAISEARAAYDASAFTDDDFNVVLRRYAGNVSTTRELSTLIAVGGVERPISALSIFRPTLLRMANTCQNSTALGRLVVDVSKDVAWLVPSFTTIAGQRVLQFAPPDIITWLQSSAFTTLKAPTNSQLIEHIRGGSGSGTSSLSSYLQLLEYVSQNMDAGDTAVSVPDILTGLLKSFCTARMSNPKGFSDACCEVVTHWSSPLIAEHADATLDALSSLLLQHFPSKSTTAWSVAKSSFAEALCQAMSKHEMNDSLSRLMDTVLAALLPSVRFSDPAPELVNAFHLSTRAQTPIAMSFWARFAMRCEKRTKLLKQTSDMPSMLKSLPGWQVARPDAHMLFAFLRLLKILERYNEHHSDHDETSAVVKELLQPLKTQLKELFSDESISKISYAEVEQLKQEFTLLKTFEEELFPAPHQWIPRIKTHSER